MLSAFAQLSRAQSGTPSVPEANPGRPTVSTPATLTPVGYLQFENGALFAEDSAEFSKRIGIEQVTKLSVLPRLELFLQSEPLAISLSRDQTVVREGEVFVGVQSVLFVGDQSRPTVSISYVRRVHRSVAPRSSDKHCPFHIPWGSSQFPGRYGISHNHSKRATPWVISGRFPVQFARIWSSTQDSIMD